MNKEEALDALSQALVNAPAGSGEEKDLANLFSEVYRAGVYDADYVAFAFALREQFEHRDAWYNGLEDFYIATVRDTARRRIAWKAKAT